MSVAVGATFLAAPILIAGNLPERGRPADTVAVVASASTESSTRITTTTTVQVTTSTVAPATTAPPTTAPPTTAPPTTTTAPPRPAAVAPATTAPPPPPPTTRPPAPPPPPPQPSGSVEAIIHAHFGAAGDQAVAVADCESGLNPSARSPHGYRGLFQLSPSHAESFRAVTGRDFEDAWDEADPNTQYARYLYGRSGWAPWGGCAP